jgi:hypothetical protein
MKAGKINSTNASVAFRKNGTAILYSYTTPVAAHIPGKGYVKTNTYFSATTSRHINKWVDGNAETVEHVEIWKLANN